MNNLQDHKLSPLKGILIATPLGVFLAVLMTIIPWTLDRNTLDIIGMIFLHSLVGSILGLAMAVIFGLPLHFLYVRLGILSVWLYLIGGVSGAVIFWLITSYPIIFINFKSLALFVISGVFTSWIFWYLVVKSD
jgi:hypothetical protein